MKKAGNVIDTAMLFAAGKGTRMAPLTDTCPKPLIPVAGKPLIDHMLDRLVAGGIERALVNVHWLADAMQAHLTRRQSPRIEICDERSQLLETGGGLKAALPRLVGQESILIGNCDTIWLEPGQSAVAQLRAAWDPDHMDVLLLLVPMVRSTGFDGPGDFFLGPDGRPRFRGEADAAPYNYMGLHITKPEIVRTERDAVFSLSRVWRRLAPLGRLHATIFDGDWFHVGDPDALGATERALNWTGGSGGLQPSATFPKDTR
jgi:N-acetyl-alpha-D-muramate 1-phosphate uridylyltransferase